MKLYQQLIPEYAEVKMNSNWVKIDPSGIVLGDIIRITPGCYIPADIRIIEVRKDKDLLILFFFSSINQ